MQAVARLTKEQSKPETFSPEPARVEKKDTVITSEPKMELGKEYICVNADSYLDNYDEF